jgi:hypothetical protein
VFIAAARMLGSNVGRRRAESSTVPAITTRSAPLYTYQAGGRPPPHTVFIAASAALASLSADCHIDSSRKLAMDAMLLYA